MSKYSKWGVLMAFCCIISCFSLSANTVTLGSSNATYSDLGSAVDGVHSGDTILLTSDIYLTNPIWIGKNITLLSNQPGGFSIKKRNSQDLASIGISRDTFKVFNVHFDLGNHTSYYQTTNKYYYFITITSEGTLYMDINSSIRNGRDGAVLNVCGTAIGVTVCNNQSTQSDLGIVYLLSGGKMINSRIYNNKLSGNNMTAVFMSGGSLINSTVADNHSTSRRYTTYAINSSGDGCIIENCIVYGNDHFYTQNSPTVKYSCIQGDISNVRGHDNINVNPEFYPDYSLPKHSPCVNKGNDSYINSLAKIDIEGNRRKRESSVDMGAFEFQPEYFKTIDSHYSCGKPFTWINGETYTETTSAPKDTILGGVHCDTIVTLDLTVYPSVDTTLIPSYELTKVACSGENITFNYSAQDSIRTEFQWIDESNTQVGTGVSYETTIGSIDQTYRLIASLEGGVCPDTIPFHANVNHSLATSLRTSTINGYYAQSCLSDSIGLDSLLPVVSYCSAYTSIQYYYQLNDGEWTLWDGTKLYGIANNATLRWKVEVITEDETIESIVPDPQTITLIDTVVPVWNLSDTNQYLPVLDSVTGIVNLSLTPNDLLQFISDNCPEQTTILFSEDSISFSDFNGYQTQFNVFNDTTLTLYWKAVDGAGNSSDILPLHYSIEKNTEFNDTLYAIVRDTSICNNDFPFNWHGHTFAENNESAVVGAAHLTVHIDSSFYHTDVIVNYAPIVWRDSITYDKDTVITDFHKINEGTCDSIYSLHLTIKTEPILDDTTIIDTMVCIGALPVEIDGHLFTFDGERDTLNNTITIVHIDSSYYRTVIIKSETPIVWMDSIACDHDTIITNFHKLNENTCDSIYTLHFTLLNGIIQYDTTLCIGALPVEINNHLFSFDGEKDTLNNIITTVHVDSSYYRVDSIESDTPILWMDSIVCDHDTIITEFHKINENACDSIYTLYFTLVNDTLRYDTTLCIGALPVEINNHLFTFDGEKDTLNNIITTVHIDSSYYRVDTIKSYEPIVWRDSITYARTTTVTDFHVANEGMCDSIFSLVFTRLSDTIIHDTMICIGSLPIEINDHLFTYDGESDTVGKTITIVHYDSSYVKFDTLAVCVGSKYKWINGNSYSSGSSYDLIYNKENEGTCDSIIYMHLTVHKKLSKTVEDTSTIIGCANYDDLLLGFGITPNSYTDIKWYIQGEHADEWDGVIKHIEKAPGYDNFVYMLVAQTPDGACSDTTVYITYSDHDLETGDTMKVMNLDAGENCMAKARIFDYIPDFNDRCSLEPIDTVCYFRVNEGEIFEANKGTYYNFKDGDIIRWEVGMRRPDGSPYTVSSDLFFQTVSVIDRTAPTIDALGLSNGNLIHPVVDSIVGNVTVNVPLSDITDHIKDNCDATEDLTILSGTDSLSLSPFNGNSFTLNAYSHPSQTIYYAISDSKNNTRLDSVVYQVERNTVVGNESYAIVRDTMVCPGEMPYTWHNTSFAYNGATAVVGAAYLTVWIDSSMYKTDTVIVCDSYTWRDGKTYTVSTNEPIVRIENTVGCDSVYSLHLTVLNTAVTKDSITLCKNDLPYNWKGYLLTGDTTIHFSSSIECDSVVQIKVTILPEATETIVIDTCDSYTINGETYTESGTYTQYLTSAVTGCDSILTLQLSIGHPTEGTETITVCEAQLPYNWNGYSIHGDTVITTKNHMGCDSVISIHLNRLPYMTETITDSACDSYTINGETFTESGTYTQHLYTKNGGCDSILTLQLTIGHATESTETITVCEDHLPYQWNNIDLQSDTTLLYTKDDGCDSIIHLHLIVLPVSSQIITDEACDSYTLNGETYTESGTYEQHFVSLQTGCDSILTLNLTIWQTEEKSEYATISEKELPYVWNGYNVKRDTTILLTTQHGCDSIVTLHLTVIPAPNVTISDTACGSYTLNGITYTTSGTYEQHFVSDITGYDSTVTLILTILQPTESIETITVCEAQLPILWNGYEIYNDTTVTLTNQQGCDSIINVRLNRMPAITSTITETACGRYTLNDITYTESGTYTQNLVSRITGCDSILTLNLTILKETYGTDTFTICPKELPYEWEGYKIRTDTVLTLTNAQGCDSIVNIVLNVLPAITQTVYVAACGSYIHNDFVYTQSGVYEQKLVSKVTGCDSIIKLDLTILSPSFGMEKINVCAKDLPYIWEGHEIVSDTVLTIPSMKGCDSTITLKLNILPIQTVEVYDTICGGSYYFNGMNYTKSGVYTHTLASLVTGCDSIVTLHLHVKNSSRYEETLTICDNNEYAEWNGIKVYGDTTITTVNSVGCDSIIQLHLIKLRSSRSEVTEESCLSFEWNDSIYTESGTYEKHFMNTDGCDSTAILHLTILQPSYYAFADSAKIFYNWNGKSYRTTGDYEQTYTNSVGCDSIVTLHLTILPSEDPVDSIEFTMCDNLLPYIWDGKELTQEDNIFTYKDQYGRDSFFIVHINLLQAKTTIEDESACDSYQWHGMKMTKSGIYYDTLQTVEGCDSICQLNLTIHHRTDKTITLSSCRHELPVNWNGYQIQSDTTLHLISNAGCDSIIKIHLVLHDDILTTPIIESVCGKTYDWRGKELTHSGIYYDTLSTIYGCDSILTLELSLYAIDTVKIADTIVIGTTYTMYGFNVTPEKIGRYEYSQTLVSQTQCDSIVLLDLHVQGREIIIDNVYITGGESISRNGVIESNRFCSTDSLTIHYKVLEGNPDSFRIVFDEKARAQGFDNFRSMASEQGSITLIVPENVKPGTYEVTLQLYGEGKVSNHITNVFHIGINEHLLQEIGGNIIKCDDIRYDFETYNWYKNGEDLSYTEQSYRETSGIGGYYSLICTVKDDQELYVCSQFIQPNLGPFRVWTPTKAERGKAIIHVDGVSDAQLEGANLYIYALNGLTIYHTDKVKHTNQILFLKVFMSAWLNWLQAILQPANSSLMEMSLEDSLNNTQMFSHSC